MKIHKQISFTASILYMVAVTETANINAKCPSGKNWYFRAKTYCSSVEKYTCLLDSVRNIYKENCNGPKTEPPGDKTVVNSGNFDTEPCSLDRFQPFSFSTSQGNECVYKKSMCNAEGQLFYNNGTSRYDRKCICDYSKEFIFVSTKRVNMCSCDPKHEDCSCYIKHCSKGQILTPDYHCVKIEESYGSFVCGNIGITPGTTTVRNRFEAVRSNTDESVGKIEKRLEVLIVCIVGLTLLGLLCMYLLLPVDETIAKLFNAARCQNRQKFDQNVIQHLQDNNKMESNEYEILNSPKESKVCYYDVHDVNGLDNSSGQQGINTEENSPKSPTVTRDDSKSTNDITYTDQILSNSETVTESTISDSNPLKADQNTKTEGEIRYRLQNASVETYRNRPYEFTVLRDLIEDGTIDTYDSPEDMPDLNADKRNEETLITHIIKEHSRAYTIRRRKVEPQSAAVMQELNSWAGGGMKNMTHWAGGEMQKIADKFKFWIGYTEQL
ncbi:uncharacterized protein LOC143074670 isoform X2 [Mytilus galloprovincialis]|uniref:uncharacterized protein LOC143074670 isoform X2 n=1 Tax=Mytilus galloprovincialis TaxID=29158 RepID=UPI003F7CA93B